MINLSFDELRLIGQIRNISDYENKSKEDLIKALSETKPKTETPKTETPKQTKPKLEIKNKKKKFKKFKKDFKKLKLRHKLSKKEIQGYRKGFYVAKNKKYLSESEIKKTNKNLTKLTKSLTFKKFSSNIDSVNYENLDNYDYNYDFADDDEYRKIGSIRTLFKELDSDYYKPIRTDGGFAGRNNNYIDIRVKEIDMKIYSLKNILM